MSVCVFVNSSKTMMKNNLNIIFSLIIIFLDILEPDLCLYVSNSIMCSFLIMPRKVLENHFIVHSYFKKNEIVKS